MVLIFDVKDFVAVETVLTGSRVHEDVSHPNVLLHFSYFKSGVSGLHWNHLAGRRVQWVLGPFKLGLV